MKTLNASCGRDQNSFGLVRLCAAIAVVISHAYLLVGGTLSAEPLATLTSYPLGAHAVHVFFALSGFLIAMSWHNRPDLFHFMAGRFLRLFPALLVVTLTVIAAGASLISNTSPISYALSPEALFFFARTVLLLDGGGQLPSVFPQDDISGAILATVWTLRYEVFCYLSIPAVAFISLRNPKISTILVLGIIAISATLLITRNTGYNDAGFIDNMARFFFAFYLGVAAWITRRYLRLSGWIALPLCLFAFFSLGSAIAKPVEILTLAYLTFWLGTFKFGSLTKFTNQEDISYGIYLMGYPVQQAMIALVPDIQTPIINITLTLTLVVPMAFVSWRIVERPAMRHRAPLAAFAQSILVRLDKPSWFPAKPQHIK